MELSEQGFLFRFRSAKALLDGQENGGFLELERQAIYFAKPGELNDPMEGLTDAFWDGDSVLWENLFRNYALSLFWYMSQWLLVEPGEVWKAKVMAFPTEADLPSDSFREIYKEFCSDFCAEIDSKGVATMLGRRLRPLRRERLINLLFLAHKAALPNLFKVLKRHRLSEIELPMPGSVGKEMMVVVRAWEETTLEPPTADIPIDHQLEVLASSINTVNHQLELEFLNQSVDLERGQKLVALMARFPESYVDAFLDDLHFTPWRVACFSRRCTNASMWGTYGSEHRGAALVFRTEPRGDTRYFRVNGMLGSGAKGFDLQVHPVSYQNRPPPLDSFLHISMLPMARLEQAWMKSESGIPSVRLQEMTNNMPGWREAHWAKALERANWKHPDWRHEDEQRLIASTAFTDDPAPKALTYQFSQLEGIVFGMRMSREDKIRAVRLIEKKCRAEGRSDFRFFQARYSSMKGEMETVELRLLRS